MFHFLRMPLGTAMATPESFGPICACTAKQPCADVHSLSLLTRASWSSTSPARPPRSAMIPMRRAPLQFQFITSNLCFWPPGAADVSLLKVSQLMETR